MDIAASIQSVLQDVLLKMTVHIHRVTGKENLCLSVGVVLNAVANGQLLKKGPFKRIRIQTATLGFVAVGNDNRYVDGMLQSILDMIASYPEGHITNSCLQFI